MAPHRNHVEARANREPARQYVSESHDHKPDVQPVDFFLGTSFSVDQLAIDHQCLSTHLKALRMAHADRDASGVKLAAEAAAKLAGQMQMLSAHLASVAVRHLNRRPR